MIFLKRLFRLRTLLILLCILFLLSLPSIAEHTYQYFINRDQKYLAGAEFLTSVADSLGRTQDNQLYFYHNKNEVTLYPYDEINLIFYTDETVEGMTNRVKSLETFLKKQELSSEYYLPRKQEVQITFLPPQEISLKLGDIVLKKYIFLSKETAPFITKWIYKKGKAGSVMEISLIEPNRVEEWTYKGRVLKGNLIILTLNLYSF